jgi:hypothetical protein
MNSFRLKWIAIITMLIDHVAAVLLPQSSPAWMVMRIIGRLAFPIFVFLLVEGFHHTKDVNKYLIRLGIFALLSEVPFDLAFYGTVIEFTHQNIFFTLFLGLACIYLMSLVEKRYGKNVFMTNVLNGVITLIFCVIAFFLRTDYSYAGILLIAAFYLFRGNKILQTFTLFFVSAFIIGYINVFATLAIIPIGFYNGEKGKSMKYFFYIFYPAHLLILAGINLLL